MPAASVASRRRSPDGRSAVRRTPRPGSAGGWRHRLPNRPDPSGSGTSGGSSGEGAPQILVVDDEPAIRTICRVNLEASGIPVTEAADGAEALERIRTEQPALVLLDLMMPRVDGWEVAERLAADPETRDIPVVFLSARASREDLEQAYRAGAVGYVVKPFDPLSLSTTIASVLERLERGEREQLRDEIVKEP